MRRIFILIALSLSLFTCTAQVEMTIIGENRNVVHPGLTLLLDHAIGVVIGGQSNAEGTNADTPSTTPVDLTAPIVDVNMRVSGSTFAVLDYPDNNKGSNYGCNLTLGYYLREKYNRPVYMDVVALGGAPVAAEVGHQDFNVATRELYPDLLASLLAVQAKIILEDRTPFMILVWIQGERDTDNSGYANAYDDNLSDVVNSLIADGVNLKAIIVNTLNKDLDTDPTFLEIVQTKQLEFINRKAYAWRLDMNIYTLGVDDIHFTGASQEQIGIDIVENIIDGQIITEVENVDISFAEVIANMATAPPTAYQDAMEDFYDGLVVDGIWDEILEIQCRGLDTEANSLRGWKNFYHGTNNGATHIAKSGFDYDGSTDFVNTGFIPSNAPRGLFGKFDCGMAVFCKDNQTATGIRTLAGNQDATPDRISLFQNSNITYRLCCSGSTTSTAETSFADNAFYSTFRTASNSQELYKNGVAVNSGNPATTERPDVVLYEGATNVTGTASNFFDGIISLLIIYKGTTMDQSALNTRVQSFITALAAIP